jgi:hypothetical protein
MKSRCHLKSFTILAGIIVFLCIYLTSYSQEEVARLPVQSDEFIMKLPKAAIRQTIYDTILPTISNSGRGLLHCENLTMPDDRNHYQLDGNNKLVTREEYFTESELKILREQQFMMDEQYHIDLEKQMRKDNLDLQLGEIIKGFYLQPPF